jgi:hypothetical protein
VTGAFDAVLVNSEELGDNDFLFLSPESRPLHYSNWRTNTWEHPGIAPV